MLQLAIINKQRKLWARINHYTLIASAIILLPYVLYFENFIDPNIQKYPILILFSLILITGVINSLPLNKHIEAGHLILKESSIQFVIYEKLSEIEIKDIQQIHSQINGYYGEEYFSTRKIISVHDGTSNFITIQVNGQKQKKEFFLSNKREMNGFNHYMKLYKEST